MTITTKADTMNTAVYSKSNLNETEFPQEFKMLRDEIYSCRNRVDLYSHSFNNYEIFMLTRKSDNNKFAVCEQQGENPLHCRAVMILIC